LNVYLLKGHDGCKIYILGYILCMCSWSRPTLFSVNVLINVMGIQIHKEPMNNSTSMRLNDHCQLELSLLGWHGFPCILYRDCRCLPAWWNGLQSAKDTSNRKPGNPTTRYSSLTRDYLSCVWKREDTSGEATVAHHQVESNK
jgi:hypothetical protein